MESLILIVRSRSENQRAPAACTAKAEALGVAPLDTSVCRAAGLRYCWCAVTSSRAKHRGSRTGITASARVSTLTRTPPSRAGRQLTTRRDALVALVGVGEPLVIRDKLRSRMTHTVLNDGGVVLSSGVSAKYRILMRPRGCDRSRHPWQLSLRRLGALTSRRGPSGRPSSPETGRPSPSTSPKSRCGRTYPRLRHSEHSGAPLPSAGRAGLQVSHRKRGGRAG